MGGTYAVIMAGGKGERFWPRSRASRPKQLLRLIGESTMIESTVHRIEQLLPIDHILILTNQEYVEPIRLLLPQLPAGNVVGEPVGRDTGPCVALAAAMIRARGGDDAVMILLPADHAIRHTEALVQALQDTAEAARQRPDWLFTIGVNPTEPATGYGYIHCGNRIEVPGKTSFYRSLGFKEKPNQATARTFFDSGEYRWNSGMFIWQVGAILREFERYAPDLAVLVRDLTVMIESGSFSSGLAERFGREKKISIDYAVMEHAEQVMVAECGFDWDDVGSWTALRNFHPADDSGNVSSGLFAGFNTHGLTVCGRPDHLIAAIGVDDLVIVDTEDVTLVCKADQAQKIKELLKAFHERPELKKFL